MLLLTWSPELTWPEPGDAEPNAMRTIWSGMTNTEAIAWCEQRRAGHSFGYEDIRDAQNDAARGVMEAIYAMHVFKVYLIAERLTP